MSGALAAVVNMSGGKGAYSPQLSNRSVISSQTTPTVATVGVGLNGTNGVLYTRVQAVNTNRPDDWAGPSGVDLFSPKNPGQFYEARLTTVSGTGPEAGSTVGAWLSLSSTTYEWRFSQSGIAEKVGVWRIEIRKNSGSVVASADYDMHAIGE